MVVLVYCVPLAVLSPASRTRRIPVLEGSLAAVLFVEALRTQRVVDLPHGGGRGPGGDAPGPAGPGGAMARRWAGAGLAVCAIAILAAPSVPAGTVSPTLPVQAFDYLSSHPGRIFTEYTWGDYSIARHRATFADGRTDLFEGDVLTEFFAVTDLTTNPDPILAVLPRLLRGVGAADAPLAEYLSHDPRWHVVDRTAVALVFARR